MTMPTPMTTTAAYRSHTKQRLPRLAVQGILAMPCLAPIAAHAMDMDAVRLCQQVADPAMRLACYDRATERRPAEPPAADAPTPPAVLLDSPVVDPRQRSLIGDRWGLGAPPEDSRFDVRAHRPNYILLGRVSDAPNRTPGTPSKPPLANPLNIQGHEAKYQLSFKVKLADFGRELQWPLSVWAGYTQQSHWQVFNSDTSRPFRETNYEPELLVATHPDLTLWGWRWRLAALGINHQSNGRSEPLSRSWNRIVAQFGVERGDLAVVLRPWVRIREATGSDDNPDLVDYLGHGDS